MKFRVQTDKLFSDVDPFKSQVGPPNKQRRSRSSSAASSISQTNSFEYDHHLTSTEEPSSASSTESFCIPLNDHSPRLTAPVKTLHRPPSLLFHLPRRQQSNNAQSH
ncbi:hypothetical protein E3P99_00495 [Wallemia hederae]|uniref:Uncharacterized protein n=1 Tax=Wallemia hederae TaxID=1540922 RepID=A0A4V4LU61_9BASI|nr:hypothetical protein E3P99_00495 [Wallemia hederae]